MRGRRRTAGLTARQALLLEFIEQSAPIAPSFAEMAAVLGVKSKSCIHRMLDALEDAGYVRRLHKRARSLELLPRPDMIAELRALDDPRVDEILSKFLSRGAPSTREAQGVGLRVTNPPGSPARKLPASCAPLSESV